MHRYQVILSNCWMTDRTHTIEKIGRTISSSSLIHKKKRHRFDEYSRTLRQIIGNLILFLNISFEKVHDADKDENNDKNWQYYFHLISSLLEKMSILIWYYADKIPAAHTTLATRFIDRNQSAIFSKNSFQRLARTFDKKNYIIISTVIQLQTFSIIKISETSLVNRTHGIMVVVFFHHSIK